MTSATGLLPIRLLSDRNALDFVALCHVVYACVLHFEIETADDNGQTSLNNLHIETKRMLAEVTVILERVAARLESDQKYPEVVLLRNQLEMLRGMVMHAVESVAKLHEQLAGQAR